ncbi:MAG: methyltransferase domain-containing protein [Hyphomonadaceae bacterium]|nr:methyltransferase domain-containing protein [Hyphomonadaceae bacterium]
MTMEIRWDPETYLRYREERARPGFELLARIAALPQGPLADLGCGTGDHALAMAKQYPGRQVIGLDQSPHMLQSARTADAAGAVQWVEGRIESFAPPAPLAMLFSNAALQWLGAHETLLPRLLQMLAPGGVLAVQMPSNLKSRAHALAWELCLERGWGQAASGLFRVNNVLEPGRYYDLLRAEGVEQLELWETTYQHPLGPEGVTGWLAGTALRPVLSSLPAEDQEQFLHEFDRRVRLAYPPQADGRTLYPQSRLFLIARRPEARG